jgi:hypothetical protein
LKLIRLAAASLAVALGLMVFLPRLPAADSPSGLSGVPNQVTGDEINDAQRAAVDRGLAWLAVAAGPRWGI